MFWRFLQLWNNWLEKNFPNFTFWDLMSLKVSELCDLWLKLSWVMNEGNHRLQPEVIKGSNSKLAAKLFQLFCHPQINEISSLRNYLKNLFDSRWTSDSSVKFFVYLPSIGLFDSFRWWLSGDCPSDSLSCDKGTKCVPQKLVCNFEQDCQVFGIELINQWCN